MQELSRDNVFGEKALISPERQKIKDLFQLKIYREIVSMKVIEIWAKEHFGKWKSSLSRDERYAIGWYTADGYRSYNHSIRTGKQIKASEQKRFESFCSAIDRAKIPENIFLYRKSSYHVLGNLIDLQPQEWLGKTITDKAYLSTTLQRYKATAFTNDFCEFPCGCSPIRFVKNLTIDRKVPKYLRDGIIMTIKVPKGTNGAYIGTLTTRSDYIGRTEEEVILGRNQMIRIDKVEVYKSFVEMECEIIMPKE